MKDSRKACLVCHLSPLLTPLSHAFLILACMSVFLVDIVCSFSLACSILPISGGVVGFFWVGFFLPAWEIIRFSSRFLAELFYNPVLLIFESGAATTVWRTSGLWACSLTSPAVPCTLPSPPVSSRFPWDVASVMANAKSTYFLVAVRNPYTRHEEGRSAHECPLCSSFSRACIASRDPYCGWVKESGVCTQLVLGSKWVRILAGWAVIALMVARGGLR